MDVKRYTMRDRDISSASSGGHPSGSGSRYTMSLSSAVVPAALFRAGPSRARHRRGRIRRPHNFQRLGAGPTTLAANFHLARAGFLSRLPRCGARRKLKRKLAMTKWTLMVHRGRSLLLAVVAAVTTTGVRAHRGTLTLPSSSRRLQVCNSSLRFCYRFAFHPSDHCLLRGSLPFEIPS